MPRTRHQSYPNGRRRFRLCGAALAIAVALSAGVGAAACGGLSTAGVARAPTTTIVGPLGTVGPVGTGSAGATGLLAYASCMRSHGIANFPDPTGNGGVPKDDVVRAFRAVSNAKVQAASNECAHLLPRGGSLSGQPTQAVPSQDQQDYLKAAACMRSHGIANFPDPVFSNGSVSFPISSSVNSNSAPFSQARQTCQKLIPAGLPDSGRGE